MVLGEGLQEGGANEATANAVVAFVLVNTTNSVDMQVLADGDTIDVSGQPPVTLRVQTEPAIVGSVAFYVDGNEVRIENHSLYAIAGNNLSTGLYNPWTLPAGSHIVKATPYSLSGGGGTPGTSLTQTFLIQ